MEEKDIVEASEQSKNVEVSEQSQLLKDSGLVTTGKAPRNAMLDLLRIVAMFFIVLHHLTITDIGLTDMQTGIGALRATYLSSAAVDCFVIIGVNLFFLISGYFSVKLQPRKILLLLIKVYIYWIISVLLAMAFGLVKFESVWKGILYCLSGVSEYWFICVYVLLLLFSPALNAIAKLVAEKRATKYFVFITVLFFCIIGFVADYIRPVMGTNSGYSIIWASMPYLYGRLIKLKDGSLKKRKPIFWLAIYAVLSLINYIIIAVLIALDKGSYAWHFYGYNNPLIFFGSICFFMAFVSAKPIENKRASKVISIIASHTLAVYLWHSNNPLIYPIRAFFIDRVDPLWAKFLVLIPNALVIFALGVVIDIIYELLFGKVMKKFTAWAENAIFGKSKILEKLNQNS